ncbi:MAG: AmpG family muropeptide MFS transporter [Rhodospirillaceae bacterium]|jgi:PAT family beta-lactamase induction signal transducer AmpG|nr:AmpG family muropeptide MFS transporter [Rhodospirillaceae bacterium]
MAKGFTTNGWRGAFALYTDRRLLVILLMGFSSGLPLLLGFSTLSYWLSKEGISLTAIGGLLAASAPYSFKFLWAPLIDHGRLPLFTRLFGRRRGWMLAIQILMAASIVALGFGDPRESIAYIAAMALIVATLSASQDIVIDAYRIEILEDHEQGAGAAMTQTGYRFGLLVAGAGAIALADFVSWLWIYCFMAALVGIGMFAALIAPEPERLVEDRTEKASLRGTLRHAIIEPLSDLMGRQGIIWIILFVLLYKYGDALAGAMANPFFFQIGFSGVEIASVTKIFGVAATLVGIFAGGVLVAKAGVWWALVIGGVLQAVTNLLFAALAAAGNDLTLLAVAVGADNFAGGLGSAAFVAYLSGLCNLSFTGTQYALLTSLMAFGRTLFATVSGPLAEQTGWVVFYMSTTAIAVPGLLLLLLLRRQPISVRSAQ